MIDGPLAECPICRTEAQFVQRRRDRLLVECAVCHPYHITESALAVLNAQPGAEAPNYVLSHVIRGESRGPNSPLVSTDWLQRAQKIGPNSRRRQVNILVRELGPAKELDPPNDLARATFALPLLASVLGAANTDDALASLRLAEEENLVDFEPNSAAVQIWLSGRGRHRLERHYVAGIDVLDPDDQEFPAADRIVRLDHNSRPYKEAMASLERVIEEVRRDNGYGVVPEVKERTAAELAAGKALLSAKSVDIEKVKSVLLTTLRFLALTFTTGMIIAAADDAYAKLVALLG